MFRIEDYNNTDSSMPDIMNNRQARIFYGPLGFLLAATILAKASQAKSYLLGHNQDPWIPFKPNYFPPLPSFWYPVNYPTTNPPQISYPPVHQQQIIHIHEVPPPNDQEENPNEENIVTNLHKPNDDLIEDENEVSTLPTNFDSEETYQIDEYNAESSNDNFTNVSNSSSENHISNCTDEINFNLTEFNNETATEILYVVDDNETSGTNLFIQKQRVDDEKRKKLRNATRRGGLKTPSNDYLEKASRTRTRRRPNRRRTTTPSYEYYEDRRTRRPTKNKNKNRRPIRDEYYDDYNYEYDYSNELFARQGTTTSTTETDTTTITPATNPTPTMTPGTNYTYGPTQHPGYGPSNGNEHVSFTYGPPTGPKQDGLAHLFDWYNPYSKNSIITRLQELLSPNNFYNQYDYHDNF